MVNVIWQIDNFGISDLKQDIHNHFEYIDSLVLKYVPHKNIFDNKSYNTIINNSIIVFSSFFDEMNDSFKEYLKRYDNLNYNYILFDLSDNLLNNDFSYYKKARHVFKFHYNKDLDYNNVTVIPIGFDNGYFNRYNNITISDNRNIDITFIGEIKNDRLYLIKEILENEYSFIHTSKSNKIPIADVIDIYKRTVFIPCPIGDVSVDTTRLYNSLECGCIPILKKYNGEDYYKQILGVHPFPIVNEWSDINNLMDNLDNENLDNLITFINNWYKSYMDDIAKNVMEIVKMYVPRKVIDKDGIHYNFLPRKNK